MSAITFVHSTKLLCKQFSVRNGAIVVTPYDNGYMLNNTVAEFDCIDDLFEVIQEFAKTRRVAIIKGVYKEHYFEKACRRLFHHDQTTGHEATIVSNPEGNVFHVFDVDYVDNPSGVKPAVTDIEQLVIDRLPPEFKSASYIYNHSSSAGVHGFRFFKLHLFFQSNAPLTDQWMRTWAQNFNFNLGERFLDDRCFLPSQLIYIGDPVFVGMDDPIGDDRWGFVPKINSTVDIKPVVRQSRSDPVITALATGGDLSDHNLEQWFVDRLSQVGQLGEYRTPLFRAICFAVAVIKRRGQQVDAGWIKGIVHRQVGGVLAGSGRSHYLSDRHLNSIIAWADAHVVPKQVPEANRVARKLGRAHDEIMANAAISRLITTTPTEK